MSETHGKTGTSEYNIWVQMRRRCRSPKASGYQNYGGRGIQVCDRWDQSFEAFLEDMGPRPDGYSIDRENTNGDYEPDNCRWVSHEVQNNNRRSNVTLTHKGKTMTVSEWSRELGISHKTIHSRIKRNWPVEKILSPKIEPRNHRAKIVKHDGKSWTLRQWSEHLGVPIQRLHWRIFTKKLPLATALSSEKLPYPRKRKSRHV